MAGPESPCHIKPQKCHFMWANNLFQDSHEDIADGTVEIGQTFQTSYNSINIAIGGILPHDASWSINQVLIKEVDQILKAKCSKSFFIYIGYNSCWTVANGSLNPETSSFRIMYS